jgi:hypothetical protein
VVAGDFESSVRLSANDQNHNSLHARNRCTRVGIIKSWSHTDDETCLVMSRPHFSECGGWAAPKELRELVMS